MMDSFELNKMAGAVLATGLGVMAVSIISEAIYSPAVPEKPGYVIATGGSGGEGGATSGGSGGATVASIAARLQTADPKKGEAAAKKCLACHTLEKGQPNKVGPNLYGVVGSPIIRPETGFKFSSAFEAKGKEGFTWTFEHLDDFLTNPRSYIQGTAMSFAGIKKPDERADVIAYLRTLSDNPVPLPPAPPAGDTAAQAPASGAAGSTAAAQTPAPAGNAGASGGSGATPASFVEEVKNADVKKGEAAARKCLACHTLQKGQPNKVGPNLYGVVGTPIIRPETGYNYSQAFQDKGKAGFTWTYDNLNHVPDQSAGIHPRHQDDLRRHHEGAGAGRRGRLSEDARRHARAAAGGSRRRRMPPAGAGARPIAALQRRLLPLRRTPRRQPRRPPRRRPRPAAERRRRRRRSSAAQTPVPAAGRRHGAFQGVKFRS